MMCTPESVVIHKESKTPGRKNKEAYNTNLFFKRNNISSIGDMDYFLQKDSYDITILYGLTQQFINQNNMIYSKVYLLLLTPYNALIFLRKNLFGNMVDTF